MVGDRLADEAQALRDVTDWLDKFVRTGMPELVELRPRSDHPLHYRKLASNEPSWPSWGASPRTLTSWPAPGASATCRPLSVQST
jgi:hypothetical protein